MVFEPVSHLSDSQIEDLHRMYQAEWWSKGRELNDVQQMLQNSNVIVAFCDSETKRLIAFSRILTDFVFRGTIYDVIVDSSQRKEGLGRALMDAIVHHPSLKSVQHLDLCCLPELIPFYQKWGFTEDLGKLRFMRRVG